MAVRGDIKHWSNCKQMIGNTFHQVTVHFILCFLRKVEGVIYENSVFLNPEYDRDLSQNVIIVNFSFVTENVS